VSSIRPLNLAFAAANAATTICGSREQGAFLQLSLSPAMMNDADGDD
jgi:hypothetical protein